MYFYVYFNSFVCKIREGYGITYSTEKKRGFNNRIRLNRGRDWHSRHYTRKIHRQNGFLDYTYTHPCNHWDNSPTSRRCCRCNHHSTRLRHNHWDKCPMSQRHCRNHHHNTGHRPHNPSNTSNTFRHHCRKNHHNKAHRRHNPSNM